MFSLKFFKRLGGGGTEITRHWWQGRGGAGVPTYLGIGGRRWWRTRPGRWAGWGWCRSDCWPWGAACRCRRWPRCPPWRSSPCARSCCESTEWRCTALKSLNIHHTQSSLFSAHMNGGGSKIMIRVVIFRPRKWGSKIMIRVVIFRPRKWGSKIMICVVIFRPMNGGAKSWSVLLFSAHVNGGAKSWSVLLFSAPWMGEQNHDPCCVFLTNSAKSPPSFTSLRVTWLF